MSDMSFLSRDEALLLFNGEEGRNVSIGVYSFPLQRMVCECRFPFLQPISRVTFLTRPESRFGEKCPSSIAKCLLPDPEVNVLAMTFYTSMSVRPVCCVLSLQRFHHMYNALLKIHPDRDTFEWEEWGPTVTRWLPYHYINLFMGRSTFGSRVLAWGQPSSLNESSRNNATLILLDFNPRPIKRGATTDVEGESHQIVITDESSWYYKRDKIKIKSSLPYRAFTSSWFLPYSFLRFDGSTILATAVSLFSGDFAEDLC
jgi:hypothetical protein